jgi:dTMP kinase
MSKGYLIVFTGIDGSGKTTQAKLLVEELQKDGIRASYVWSRWGPLFLRPLIDRWKNNIKRDPGTPKHTADNVKDRKQKLLRNPVLRWIWLFLFFVDYGLQIFVKVRLSLFKEQFVVCDRMHHDAIVDQAVNIGDKREWLLGSLNSFWMRIFFPKPEMVMCFDCPEDIAFSRKSDTANLQYLVDRRKIYLKLAEQYGWIKIDGTSSIEEIAHQIKNKVYRKFGISGV